MPRVPLPIASGFYVSQSPPNVDKRTVNLYPVVIQTEAASNTALYNTPGIDTFAINTGVVGSRGSILDGNGVPYFVIGNSLFSFDRDGVATDHGTIIGVEDVSMSSNGLNIVIVVPDGLIYFLDLTTFILESTSNPPPTVTENGIAKTVTFKDRFYVYTSDTVFFSGSDKSVNGGKDFAAGQFEDAEFNVDRIVKGFNNLNQLYIFGIETIEIYQTIAVTSVLEIPFQRVIGGTIEIGCRAPNSVQSYEGGMVFLGGPKNQRPGVYQGVGSSFRKISTPGIDNILHRYTDEEILLARGFTYALNGNSFYVISVGDNTLVYDSVASSLAGAPRWHERQSGITSAIGFAKWRAVHGLLAYGKLLVGDTDTGTIGFLDFDIKTEFGNPVERFFTTQPFTANLDSIFAHEIELFMNVGVGDINEVTPKMLMSYSDDGGNIFNNPIPRSMGKVGEYRTRVRWSRQGRIPVTRTYLFRTTDTVDVNIYGLFANSEVFNSG